nr:hypothetical protein [Acidimicrobiia bacterium]
MNANHGDPVPGPSRRSGCVGPRRLTPHFEPQALDRPRRKAHYADTNFHLLGAVLEAVTGERIAHLFDAFLFAPLGMADTSSFPHPPRSGASPEPRRGGLVEGRGIADQWGFGHAEGERRNRLDSHRPTPLHVGSRRR